MISIDITCTNGHRQRLGVDPRLGVEFAHQQAGLMDGTSPHYVVSPVGTDSPIGKCGICKAQLTATVSDYVQGPPVNLPVVSTLAVPKTVHGDPVEESKSDKVFIWAFLISLVAAVFWFVGREIWKLFVGESI